jgi:hypothetical protein
MRTSLDGNTCIAKSFDQAKYKIGAKLADVVAWLMRLAGSDYAA